MASHKSLLTNSFGNSSEIIIKVANSHSLPLEKQRKVRSQRVNAGLSDEPAGGWFGTTSEQELLKKNKKRENK